MTATQHKAILQLLDFLKVCYEIRNWEIICRDPNDIKREKDENWNDVWKVSIRYIKINNNTTLWEIFNLYTL